MAGSPYALLLLPLLLCLGCLGWSLLALGQAWRECSASPGRSSSGGGGRSQKPKHPTTGLIAITFALHICSDVHLAGFKYNFSDRNSVLHYYGNDTMSLMIQNGYHDIAAEQRLLKELIDHHIVINLTEE